MWFRWCALVLPVDGLTHLDIAHQKVWQRLYSHVVYKASNLGLTEIDTAAVSAIMLGLEHHLKSIISAVRQRNNETIY